MYFPINYSVKRGLKYYLFMIKPTGLIEGSVQKACLIRTNSFIICFSPQVFNPISITIMLTCPCNVDPLTAHFYIEKLRFTGVYIIFLILLKNISTF